MSDITSKASGATKWSFITEIAVKLVSPITNMILARLLLPEAFGAVATITMIISFAEVFTDAGFQKYIIQHEFSDEDDFNKTVNVAFWSNLSLSVLIVGAIWVFRDQLAILVGSPDLGMGIAIASASIILVAFSSIQTAVYRRNFDFKTLFFVRIAVAFLPLVITVPLAIWLRNFWALIIGTLAMHFAQSVILTARSKWKIKFYYSFNKLKEMFSFSSWSLLEAISIWLTSYIGTFLVGRGLNDYYLGLYKTSMATVNAYMAIITAAITPVVFSTLSRLQNDDEAFKEYYYKTQSLTALFVLPMGVGIFVFRDFVTRVLLGDNWMEASGFIGLWGLTSALTIVFCHLASEVYRSKGKPRISLITQLIHLAFLVPTIIVSLEFGFETLYISRSLVRLEGLFAAGLVLYFGFGISIFVTLKNIFVKLMASVIMGCVGFYLLKIMDSIGWQTISVLICIIVYFAVLWLFPKERQALKSFIKKIKK